jgi:phage shock protein A
MTEEQISNITKKLQRILDNQNILDNKLDTIQRELKEVKTDIFTIIHNQQILGTDQDKLMKDVSIIKKSISR